MIKSDFFESKRTEGGEEDGGEGKRECAGQVRRAR